MSEGESGAAKWLGVATVAGMLVIFGLLIFRQNQLDTLARKVEVMQAELDKSSAACAELRREMERLAASSKEQEKRGAAEGAGKSAAACKACAEAVPQLQKKSAELEQRCVILYEALRKLNQSAQK